MSVFGSIMSRIFGHKQAGAAETQATATPASAGGAGAPPAAPASGGAEGQPNVSASAQPGAAPMPGGGAATPAPAGTPQQPVDVAAVLAEMAEKNPQKLDWRHSIVDLMKLLGLDSSLENRKELANELNYSGDTGDSASMNIWLHKQVMQKLAENGGKVPDELKG